MQILSCNMEKTSGVRRSGGGLGRRLPELDNLEIGILSILDSLDMGMVTQPDNSCPLDAHSPQLYT